MLGGAAPCARIRGARMPARALMQRLRTGRARRAPRGRGAALRAAGPPARARAGRRLPGGARASRRCLVATVTSRRARWRRWGPSSWSSASRAGRPCAWPLAPVHRARHTRPCERRPRSARRCVMQDCAQNLWGKRGFEGGGPPLLGDLVCGAHFSDSSDVSDRWFVVHPASFRLPLSVLVRGSVGLYSVWWSLSPLLASRLWRAVAEARSAPCLCRCWRSPKSACVTSPNCACPLSHLACARWRHAHPQRQSRPLAAFGKRVGGATAQVAAARAQGRGDAPQRRPRAERSVPARRTFRWTFAPMPVAPRACPTQCECPSSRRSRSVQRPWWAVPAQPYAP